MAHLWEIDIETKKEKRLTGGNEYSVSQVIISDNGTKIAFIGKSTKRFAPKYYDGDVYLLDLNANTVLRITNNSVDDRNYTMWRTSCQVRVFEGTEAKLFTEAFLNTKLNQPPSQRI